MFEYIASLPVWVTILGYFFGYVLFVWFGCRFFGFVKDCDKDIERMPKGRRAA